MVCESLRWIHSFADVARHVGNGIKQQININHEKLSLLLWRLPTAAALEFLEFRKPPL